MIIIETLEDTMPDMEWINYLESFDQEEKDLGADFWKTIQDFYKNNGLEGVESTVSDSVYEGVDQILGKNTESYIKALLTDYCYDWLSNHPDPEEGEEEDSGQVFYPEDMLRVIYTLTKTIAQQRITIDNLQFAINHLKDSE